MSDIYIEPTEDEKVTHLDIAEIISEMTVEAMHADILAEIAALRSDVDDAKKLLGDIFDQLAPTIESLKKSPILKMLGV